MTTETKDKPAKVAMNGVDVPTLLATIGAVSDTRELAKFTFRARGNWVKGTHSRVTVKDYFGAYEPFTDGFYTNDVTADETQQDVNRNYRGNYERLLKIKRRFDPTNLFRLNANIVPG